MTAAPPRPLGRAHRPDAAGIPVARRAGRLLLPELAPQPKWWMWVKIILLLALIEAWNAVLTRAGANDG